jgi:O-acetyl-ADP-ribose deacetylase (regulator of RNase III)
VIIETSGNLLQADVEALVNTVNTVGIMGKGIALQFKRAYPDNFDAYESACRDGQVKVGKMFTYATGQMANPLYIINFPTKAHWRTNSKIEDIEAGLDDLVRVVAELDVGSLAVPPLGCGNGGLEWPRVRSLIYAKLAPLVDVSIHLYPPSGAPDAKNMPNRTKRPRMTIDRAALILAFVQYVRMSSEAALSLDGRFSLMEAQKVAYFFQCSGWPLGLDFVPSRYGPYSQKLAVFISEVEGHFVTGYGDGTGGSRATLELHDDAISEARSVIGRSVEFRNAIARFSSLVEGFEFPYGIELLSTVHYVARKFGRDVTMDDVMVAIDSWSARKSALFKPQQASVALDHLIGKQEVAV